MNQIEYTIRYASYHHRNQKRKYTNLPYIMHPMAVAGLISTVSDDSDMICASILHDVVEDCEPTIFDIRKLFNTKVAKLVDELTDISKPEDGNREERKRIDREHSASASPEGQTIKVADLIDNTSTIAYFDEDFARVYMREKELLLEVLTKADQKLVEIANKQIIEYRLMRLEKEKDTETQKVFTNLLFDKCKCSACNSYSNEHTKSARKANKGPFDKLIGE